MRAFDPSRLRSLAEVRDEESRDAFVSVYVDATDPRSATRRGARSREIRAALAGAGGAREEFEASLRLAESALSGAPPEARGLAAFASSRHGFTEAFWLAASVGDRLVLDSSPYVRPLARHADEHEAFALVLLDGARAAIHVVTMGKAELAASRRLDLIGRHKKGGMSQARYQRHRQGIVDRYLDDLVSRLEGILREEGATRVVVAGPGQAKRHFAERFSARTRDVTVAVEEVEVEDPREPGRLVDALGAVAREHEARDSAAAVRLLVAALKRGELAASGPFEVARAAAEGRADLVLLLKDHAAGGAKCEAHGAFFEAGSRCPVCGGAGTRVDLLNEAVEGALLTDATVEFVDPPNPALEGLGGAGALLRW